MNTRLINVFAFTVGAAIGSVITWKVVKTKYDRIIQDEINRQVESVKEAYESSYPALPPKEAEGEPMPPEVRAAIENIDIRQYRSVLTDEEYTEYSKEGGAEMRNKPYVIPPEEYGERLGYDMVSLEYYAENKVLVEDAYTQYRDAEIDDIVGLESLNHFGEYPDDPDTVYVRNDDRETDYEILAVDGRYEDLSDE